VTLPSGLLQPTDQHALEILKRIFKRKKHPVGAEATPLMQTSKQRSRSHILAKFIKMLSDQQLITGLSILVAALSSRCVISRYEWHVVASLAYFSATTHSLSLDVLRYHLAKHNWARKCRVIFTFVFLLFFSFAYVVDHLSLTNTHQPRMLQCALYWGGAFDSLETYELFPLIYTLIPVLAILWGKHISALTRLATPETARYRHVTTTMMDRRSVQFWSWRYNLPTTEVQKIVADARLQYDTDIRPSNGKPKISVWYFLEQYHEAYLSEIPVWVFQLVYGTTNTIYAVSDTDVYLSSDAWMLGFGQVVALGLLVLPLIALVDIMNGASLLCPHDIFTD